MDVTRATWPVWIKTLQQQGLAHFAAWALEAAGPLNILGAQILYLGQPFLPTSTSGGLRALANLLEQEDETRAFIAQLKGKP